MMADYRAIKISPSLTLVRDRPGNGSPAPEDRRPGPAGLSKRPGRNPAEELLTEIQIPVED